MAHGNPDVMLCERGIRTFETATRNTCDISAIPVGKRSLVPPLARAGVAIGADGMIVEIHPQPEKAMSDGAQSLDPKQWMQMMQDLQPYIALWKKSRSAETVAV